MSMRKMVLLSCGALLTACAAVGPDYATPAAAVTPSFVGSGQGSVGKVANVAWWKGFRDPMLDGLLAEGLAQNLDTMAAMERIRAAEAGVRGTGLAAAATGGVDANGQRFGGEGSVSGTGSSATTELSAAFVLDLFGGLRRDRERAQASLASAQDDLQTVRLAWLAEAIDAYTDARYQQEAIALTRKSIASRQETSRLIGERQDAGSATELDAVQANGLLAAAQADLPTLVSGFESAVFRLATLLNRPAGPLLAQMQPGRAQPYPTASVASGVPADLLRNRPDIRSAERDLAAAVASVGVAQADLYPSISLSGNVSTTAGAESWSFGPSLSLPVLNRGALSATRDARAAEAREAEITWRAQVSSAVEDVQTALSDLTQQRRRLSALQQSAEAYRRAFVLSQESYAAGSLSAIDLLDSERTATDAELAVAAARRDIALAWATLQIATGAGAEVVGIPRTQ